MKIKVTYDRVTCDDLESLREKTFVLESEASLIWKIPPERAKLISDLMLQRGQPLSLEGVTIKEDGFSLLDICKKIAKWIWDVVVRIAKTGYAINKEILKNIARMFLTDSSSVEARVSIDRQLNVAFSSGNTDMAPYYDPAMPPFRLSFAEEKKVSWVSALFSALGTLGIEVVLLCIKTVVTVMATHYALKYLGKKLAESV